MKSSIEELDEKEIQWLSYLFGDSIAEKINKKIGKIDIYSTKNILRKKIKIIVVAAET